MDSRQRKVTGRLGSLHAPNSTAECFVGHSQKAPWSEGLKKTCEEALSDFGLIPWFAADHFNHDPLLENVIQAIAQTRYGIYDLSYWRSHEHNGAGEWVMPRNVLIELGIAIALNRPTLLLRHTKNRDEVRLPKCLESVSSDILEFSGTIDLKGILKGHVQNWMSTSPDQDCWNRYCTFGETICEYREAYPYIRQMGQSSLRGHVADGQDTDGRGFRKIVKEVLERYQDITFSFLDDKQVLKDGYKFLFCTYCQLVRSSPFAIYYITPKTSAETFIAIGISLALERQFTYKIPKFIFATNMQHVPSLLSGHQIIIAEDDQDQLDRLRLFMPEVLQEIRSRGWKQPAPLPFIEVIPRPLKTTSFGYNIHEKQSMISLIKPDIKYQDSFLAGLHEFHQEGRMLQYNLQVVSEDFERFLYYLRAQQDRTKLPPHIIPQSHFWLIDNDEFIGILSLRSGPDETFIRISGHVGYQVRPSKRRLGYGKELLRQGLQKAMELGFTRVLLTCDEDNKASKKLIESNGGQFEDTIPVEGSPMKKLRYWISFLEKTDTDNVQDTLDNRNKASLYCNQGNEFAAAQRYEEALEAYQQAVQLAPDEGTYHYNVGLVLYELKHYQEALASYGSALQHLPNYALAYAGQGRAYFSLGEYQKAIESFDLALDLDGTLTWAKTQREEAFRLLGTTTTSSMQQIEVLGERYQLQEPIGRGGMATIYRGNDMRMDRVVAIKVLREVYSTDPKFVTRFQHEAKAASSLQHPNIVRVYDYGMSGGNYFIVMELVEGPDLRRYLRSRGVLAIDRAIIITHDIALGLGAAHRRQIVHRDVNPQNILLGRDGSIKLTDFGIGSLNAERLTTAGTVQYYAPEQAQGEIVNPAADVYALGIVMYEMLTGRTPFEGNTPVAVAMRHIQDAPQPPRQLNPNIPPALEEIILCCLQKTPEKRYRDGAQLARALQLLGEEQGFEVYPKWS